MYGVASQQTHTYLSGPAQVKPVFFEGQPSGEGHVHLSPPSPHPKPSQSQAVTSIFCIFLETIRAYARVCRESLSNSTSIVLHFALFA